MGNKPWLKFDIMTPLRVSLHKRSLPSQAKISRKGKRSLSLLLIFVLSLFLTIITPHSFDIMTPLRVSLHKRSLPSQAKITRKRQRSLSLLLIFVLSLFLTIITPFNLSASSASLRFKSILQTAQTLNEQGRQQLEQGDAEAALNTWKQAEAEYQKAKDENGVIGSQLNQTQALQALGRYRLAEQLLEQLRKTIETQSDSELKATVYRSLGDVLRVNGDLKQSEAILEESLKLALSLNATPAVIATQLSLGNTAFAQFKRAQSVNDPQRAEVESKKAVNFYRSAIAQATSPQIKLQAQLNLLNLLIETKQRVEAEKIWPEVRQAVSELSPSLLAIASKINLSRSLLKLNPINEAIPSLLSRAFAQAKTLANRRLEAYGIGYLGQFYEFNQQPQQGINLTETALKLAQYNQFFDIAYQWQWQLGRLYNNTGNRMAAIASYTEAVKTLEYLRKNLVILNPEGQFSFRDEVEPIYRQLVDLLLQSEPSQENLQQAIKQIDALQLAEIENFLGCDLSKLVVINKVPDPKAAIIYPIVLDQRLAVILQLPEKVLEYHEIAIDKNQVHNAIAELKEYLNAPNRRDEVIQKAQIFYQWIFKPIEPTISSRKDIETLVFVLDGDLRNIPMTILHDGQKYLFEKYPTAVAPQLEIFAPKPLEKSLKLFIGGVGQPQTIEGIFYERIRYFDQELNQIKTQASASETLVNDNFTLANIQQQLESENFSAIHIKTHGVFSSEPDGTFIVAYNQLVKGKDLANIIQSNRQSESQTIELLVLSACYTAQGDNRAILGLAGIAVRAGARSTISTLWEARDAANTELMAKFYQELSKPNMTRAKALQLSQKSLFEQYKAPNVWAPYVLVGNWL
jgi:CHAT domain-containing protein/Fe2+ or Zn2+ uptake regulation protein